MRLTDGMLLDLQAFPADESKKVVALPNAQALDHYTYLVAGCVGDLDMQAVVIPASHFRPDLHRQGQAPSVRAVDLGVGAPAPLLYPPARLEAQVDAPALLEFLVRVGDLELDLYLLDAGVFVTCKPTY